MNHPERESIPTQPEMLHPSLRVAEDALRDIENAGGNVDEAVAELVEGANFAALEDDAHREDAIVADEVGALRVLEGGDMRATAATLGEQPTDLLGEAFAVIGEEKGAEALEEIIDRIEAVEQELAAGAVELPSDAYRQDSAERINAAINASPTSLETGSEAVEVLEEQVSEAKEIREKLESLADEDAKTDAILEFLRNDRNKPESTFDEASLVVLVRGVSAGRLESMASSGRFPEMGYLADRISRLRLPEEPNFPVIEMHRRATRLISAETGGEDMLTWRDRLRNGEEIPEAAKRYAEQEKHLASLYLHDLRIGLYANHLGSSHDAQTPLREGMARALEYGMNPEAGDDEKRKHMLELFKKGDLMTYGRDASGLFNEKGLMAVKDYLFNLEAVGPSGAEQLFDSLGTVNLNRYSTATLRAMKQRLSWPGTGQPLDVIVTGRTGDHNNFIGQSLSNQLLSNTLIFELQSSNGVQNVEKTLRERGVRMRQLTIMGHGGEKGIAISNEYRLESDKNLVATNPLNNLIQRIEPDEDLNQRVVLYSCSQGYRYDGKGSSMAETLAATHNSTRLHVEAPTGVVFADDESRNGEAAFSVINTRRFGFARSLEKYQHVPGIERLVRRLDAKRKLGKVVVSGGKRRVVKGQDAKVRIGA